MTDNFDLRAVLDADDDGVRQERESAKNRERLRAKRNPVTEVLRTLPKCTAGGPAGCDRPVAYDGLCEGHVQRRRRGKSLDTPLKFRHKTRRLCKVEGCHRIHAARGYCGTHYDRQRLGKAVDVPIPVFRKRNIAYRHWAQMEWTAEVADALDAAHRKSPGIGKNAFLEIVVRAQLASMGYLDALERDGFWVERTPTEEEMGPKEPLLGNDRKERILHVLRTNPELSAQAIAERFGITPGAIEQMARRAGITASKGWSLSSGAPS